MTNRSQLLLIRPQEKPATARGPNSGPEIIVTGQEKIRVPKKDNSRHGGWLATRLSPVAWRATLPLTGFSKGAITGGALVLPVQIREVPGEQSYRGRDGTGWLRGGPCLLNWRMIAIPKGRHDATRPPPTLWVRCFLTISATHVGCSTARNLGSCQNRIEYS
jgi:hypothetical protein